MPGISAEIYSIEKQNELTSVISLKMPADFSFRGGNWIMLNTGIKDQDGKNIKRAYSIISSDGRSGTIQIAVRKVSNTNASNFLNTALVTGDVLEAGGPYGKAFFIQDDDPEDDLYLFATDTGITAILGILNGEACKKYRGRIYVYWFFQNNYSFLSEDYIKKNTPGELKIHYNFIEVSPPENPLRYQTVREKTASAVTDKTPGLAFISGDGFAVRIIKEILLVYGMDERYIRTEPFFNTDMKKVIPKDPSHLRTGFTTGACSAAAAKAAAHALIHKTRITRIESILPNGQKNVFPLKRCEIMNNRAVCSIVKDAGDDPDCTHLAELTAEVALNDSGEIRLSGGAGVATVTLPGLGIPVGNPSITEIPRKNIIDMVQSELIGSGYGADVIISVPDGEERAKHTTNSRLGLLGGISILGTSGIVKPYSTAAYRKSILQAIDVAYEKGIRELVFTTGGKTEFYAMKNLNRLQEESFIQVGDFIGTGLRSSFKRGMQVIYIYGMAGKLSKMADGVIQTHQKGSDVNMALLAEISEKIGMKDAGELIKNSTTARNVLDIAKARGFEKKLSSEICRRVAEYMTNYASGVPVTEIKERKAQIFENFRIQCVMIDFDGTLLGKYPEEFKEVL